ncbi:MAG: hypothetical protein FWC10_03815 [Lentimicrobiaceae bacterium]|nr:hypothetical protein [Lentimicrobiaceae bacterium]
MKKTTYTLSITLLLSIPFMLCLSCTPTLSSGSLVFVASDNSDFEKSIAAVTQSNDKTLNFTHVALLNITDTGVFVIEAVPEKGVVYSNFQDFKAENKNIFIASLKPEYQKYAKDALHQACSHLGKGYDYAFDFGNNLYYCSELVYDAYTYASDNPNFFETPLMTFKDEATGETLPYWIEYFEKLNIPIPEGKSGINPNGLSRSEKIEIINNL